MHVKHMQQHTEKTCYAETLETCSLLYMHSKRIERGGQKLRKMI